MKAEFYNPFEDFTFDTVRCFLTGEILEEPLFFPVFPKWILEDYGLEDRPFKMLDENVKRYSDLVLPCSQEVYDRLETMEDRKSTRLNSSHVKISYAVFCLNKRK